MLRQTMIDSCNCLDRFVPEGISQVSRRSEVGNTKRRSLNTRLSSGTSAGTCTGPYRNYHSKAGTKNEPWHVFGTISKKGLENRSSRFEPKNSWLSFSRGSGPPLRLFNGNGPFTVTNFKHGREWRKNKCCSTGVAFSQMQDYSLDPTCWGPVCKARG